jgi:hypothetical protein
MAGMSHGLAVVRRDPLSSAAERRCHLRNSGGRRIGVACSDSTGAVSFGWYGCGSLALIVWQRCINERIESISGDSSARSSDTSSVRFHAHRKRIEPRGMARPSRSVARDLAPAAISPASAW